MSIRIRPASFGDLPAICALHIRSWRDVYVGILPDAYLDHAIEADLAQRWRRLEHGDINLVLELDGEDGVTLAGFLVVRTDHPDGPFLDNFHIDPDHRGNGFGKAMFHAMKTRLRMKGLSGLWLKIIDQNDAARRFYKLQGGRESAPFIEEFAGVRVGFRKVHFPRL